jgi:tol-pal system protein YbgF
MGMEKMKRNPIQHLAIAISFFVLAGLPIQASAQSKDVREKIDTMAVTVEQLKTEVMLLQRQVQTMTETFNKTTGQLNGVIGQMSDNISAIRRAQSSVSTSSTDAASSITAMGERMSATDQRMERLSEQFAQLKKLIEDVPKGPFIEKITPGNAEQLFAAAYGDYSRGNYPLALDEFRQYVETYPTSELADNAQYWIGEILYAQKKFPVAVVEFERVAAMSPNGDKTPVALYKRALLLGELGQKEDSVAQFLSIIRAYPKSAEASLATQQLQQIAPEALVQQAPPPEAKPPVRKGGGSRKP